MDFLFLKWIRLLRKNFPQKMKNHFHFLQQALDGIVALENIGELILQNLVLD
jgi:hypothetical protein